MLKQEIYKKASGAVTLATVICVLDDKEPELAFQVIEEGGMPQEGSFTLHPWGVEYSYGGSNKKDMEKAVKVLESYLVKTYNLTFTEKPSINENIIEHEDIHI